MWNEQLQKSLLAPHSDSTYSHAQLQWQFAAPVCTCFCVSVREHISGTHVPSSPNFCAFFVHGCCSVLLWRRCDALCNFVFTVTSCLHTVGDSKKAYTLSDSTGGSTDLTPQRILRLTHQRAAPDRGEVGYLRLLCLRSQLQ